MVLFHEFTWFYYLTGLCVNMLYEPGQYPYLIVSVVNFPLLTYAMTLEATTNICLLLKTMEHYYYHMINLSE